jgi:hypothetical protein
MGFSFLARPPPDSAAESQSAMRYNSATRSGFLGAYRSEGGAGDAERGSERFAFRAFAAQK